MLEHMTFGIHKQIQRDTNINVLVAINSLSMQIDSFNHFASIQFMSNACRTPSLKELHFALVASKNSKRKDIEM